MDNPQKSNIAYSCYYKVSRQGENFVAEHALSFIMAGSMVFDTGNKKLPFNEGSLYLVKRNQLIKFTKQPPAGAEFKSLSVYLTQDMLRQFSMDYGIQATGKKSGQSIFNIKMTPVLKGYLQSLLVYHESAGFNNTQVMELKIKEALLLLLDAMPELAAVLFDFVEPHKIDLEAFMNKNYHFNVRLERFAYLTGRSLAAFKRDFEKIFSTPPHKWLQQKRLQEAHYLIKEKGRPASDVYLDLGFADLSHFSFAFKKQFGVSPGNVAGK